MQKLKGIVVLLTLIFLMCGCRAAEHTLMIPEASTIGGYKIITEAMNCKVVTDGDYKYSSFHSESDGRTVELYASPTELVLIHSDGNTAQYYCESFESRSQNYDNPLKSVFDRLRELEFTIWEESEEHLIYEAVQTEQVADAQQIPYTVYVLETTWVDGKKYEFRYYDYANGEVLISAEAPDEINPLLTADTPWEIDLAQRCVQNTKTGEKVVFAIISRWTGQGLSPNGSDAVTVQYQYSIYAYVSTTTGQLERLQYQDGAEVDILYSADIVKPEITLDMLPMDNETLQLSMMLIMAIESLI